MNISGGLSEGEEGLVRSLLTYCHQTRIGKGYDVTNKKEGEKWKK